MYHKGGKGDQFLKREDINSEFVKKPWSLRMSLIRSRFQRDVGLIALLTGKSRDGTWKKPMKYVQNYCILSTWASPLTFPIFLSTWLSWVNVKVQGQHQHHLLPLPSMQCKILESCARFKKSITDFPLSINGLFSCRPKKSPGACIIIFSVPRFLLSSSWLCLWSLSIGSKNIACSHCAFQGS